MSKPRYDWWGYCKGMIRRYPRLQAQRAAKATPGGPAAASRIPFGGQACAPPPGPASSLLPVQEREFQAVDNARAATLALPNGQERLKLLKLVFWAQTHTLEGAALACHISYSTAKRWHGEFVRLTARFFGLLDEAGES